MLFIHCLPTGFYGNHTSQIPQSPKPSKLQTYPSNIGQCKYKGDTEKDTEGAHPSKGGYPEFAWGSRLSDPKYPDPI